MLSYGQIPCFCFSVPVEYCTFTSFLYALHNFHFSLSLHSSCPSHPHGCLVSHARIKSQLGPVAVVAGAPSRVPLALWAHRSLGVRTCRCLQSPIVRGW